MTASSAWAAKQIDDGNEQRLLEQQTKQAAAVLSSAVVVNTQPLRSALNVQPETGPVDRALFTRAMATAVGPQKTYASASMWQRAGNSAGNTAGNSMVRLAAIGAEPAMDPTAPATQAFLRSALTKPTFTVTSVSTERRHLIVYAWADPATERVAYAERPIPPDGRSPVDSDSAFSDVHYAIYLGPRTVQAALTTTDSDPQRLPFDGRTATERVPFGDTVLTLVTTPRDHLGASLSRRLPLTLMAGGLFLTVVALVTGQLLVRRREDAEDSAAFAVGLSERLQRALLPLAIPDIPHLEVAVDYVAGTRGVDIGGDWYSVVALDGDHFAFVVGDVSGRGIDAVAVMAHARFTIRAYLLRGDSPAAALSMSSRQFDVSTDGHIITTIVGVGNWRTGEITVANAGHCKPLLLSAGRTRFVDVATGPPLGTGPVTYEPTTFTMTSGDTLFCYTDGLIERRTEDIDTGMDRLAATVAGTADGSVADLVDHSLRALRDDRAEDDIAVLAFRWKLE